MAGRKKDKHVGGIQMPLFETPSTWKLPTEFPDLRQFKYIGVDTESRDPNLQKQGPGFLRGESEAVGVSLATESGLKMYLPFGHAQGSQLDPKFVREYVAAQLSRPDQTKVFANAMYDLEALDWMGVDVKGPIADVQVAGAVIDEERPGGYGLDALSWTYLGKGKSEDLLQEAADNWSLDKKRDLWMLPPQYTGEYAEDDALNPVEILIKQLPEISSQNLGTVWDLECSLTPVLWKMRKRGVRVDLDRAVQLSEEIKLLENDLIRDIWASFGGTKVDPWSSKSMHAAFDQEGLGMHVVYTRPTKAFPHGQASFTNEFLKNCKHLHPGIEMLVDYRNMNKMRRDFIEGLVLQRNVRGRLHPQWHQLRAQDEDRENGTRTGRVASSKPNLTQIPSRHPVWGKKVRSLFVADKGGRWCKHDYSQQEPRITIHFGYLKKYPGAAEARQAYLDNPDTDYHQMTADLIEERTGQKLGRRTAKDINLGSAYGMGKDKLARKLGVDIEVAGNILRTYHEGVPFVKKLEERCMEVVHGQGYIRTVLGRKRRFDSWEPAGWGKQGRPIRSYEDAVALYGQVIRAKVHKALNAMVQGTAADQTKKAIVLLDAEGLTPQVQVYDELNQTIFKDRDAWRIKEVMENALPELTVPHAADPDVGSSWGDVEPLIREAYISKPGDEVPWSRRLAG